MSKFEEVAINEKHSDYEKYVARKEKLYERSNDVRNDFERDYTRILHSKAYGRLKHKTQVFFNIENDHICTRIEHVGHVKSVSKTIARGLGLNVDLTDAIALGHDLGHAPFGHEGEGIIGRLRMLYLGKPFWHEQNGLYIADNLELLKVPDINNKSEKNLNLTYAVRDGIISHCGEVDKNCLKPRKEFCDLYDFVKPGTFEPITWEACVVKMADKIAYLGRDIEDAISLNILGDKDIVEINALTGVDVNNTTVTHQFITDIIENSSIDKGICLSDESNKMMKAIKDFNYKKIYLNKRLNPYRRYAELIINQIFAMLLDYYDVYSNSVKWDELKNDEVNYPKLISNFIEWLLKYSLINDCGTTNNKYSEWDNKKIYRKIDNRQLYIQAILDYIAGMTDRFAIVCFNELMTF